MQSYRPTVQYIYDKLTYLFTPKHTSLMSLANRYVILITGYREFNHESHINPSTLLWWHILNHVSKDPHMLWLEKIQPQWQTGMRWTLTYIALQGIVTLSTDFVIPLCYHIRQTVIPYHIPTVMVVNWWWYTVVVHRLIYCQLVDYLMDGWINMLHCRGII